MTFHFLPHVTYFGANLHTSITKWNNALIIMVKIKKINKYICIDENKKKLKNSFILLEFENLTNVLDILLK